MTTRRARPGASTIAAATGQAAAAERAAASCAANGDAPPPPASSSSLPRRLAKFASDQPTPEQAAALAARARAAADLPLLQGAALDAHVARAWRRWRALGSPRYHCAPMVDQSELPFRLLTRRHGAEAAYTPMLAARLFAGSGLYRAEHFTTCPEDRPLFVQFCANDPCHFVAAADLVKARCDYVDLNLGCPQRIASRGRYGAFLMDDLELVRRLVRACAECLGDGGGGGQGEGAAADEKHEGAAAEAAGADRGPTKTAGTALVSVKIRLFPPEKGGIPATIAYARMLEAAGASLVAVHGRTRAMKDASAHRADWAAIAAVRAALRVPCLANGDVRSRRDADLLIEATGCEGVMSADPLLRDPGLFCASRLGRRWGDLAARAGAGAGAGAAAADGNDEEGAHERDQRQQEQEQQEQQQEKTRQAGAGAGAGGQGESAAAAAAAAAADAAADDADDAPEIIAALKSSCDGGLLVTPLESLAHCRQYLDLCSQFPVPMRMMRGHVHKLLQDWLAEHTDLRARMTAGVGGLPGLLTVQAELEARVADSGRDHPIPKPSERQLAREMERARAREEAIEAQAAEERAMAALLRREARGGRQGGEGDDEEDDDEDQEEEERSSIEAARREMEALACARGVACADRTEEKAAAAGAGAAAGAPPVRVLASAAPAAST